MGVLTCEDLHAFGDTCIAVMLHNNISAGAIGGNDHQVECIQIRSGTMNLNEYRLADFTVDTQNSGTGGGVPFHCGHTIAGLGNDACVGIARLAFAVNHAFGKSRTVDHSDGNLGFVRRRERVKELFDAFHGV